MELAATAFLVPSAPALRAPAVAASAQDSARVAKAAAPQTPLVVAGLGVAALAAGACRPGAQRRARRSGATLGRGRALHATFRREQKVLFAKDLLPEAIQTGPYGKEVETMFNMMAEAIHIHNMASLCMEEKKDKSAIGLHGFELEREFVRKLQDGSKITIAHVMMMATLGKTLLENFPEDVVLCDDDTSLLERDPVFAETAASLLANLNLIPGATLEDTKRWVSHCGTYASKEGDDESPSRYWAVTPVDTTDEFMQAKQYCTTVALIVDREPVVSFMGCPVLAFDHPSRTVTHTTGVPFFFAVKGQGSWTQLVITERDMGVYQGKYKLKGKPLPLKVGEKIKRGNDGLYDMLGTNQLTVAMGSRPREDIFSDAERVCKLLGSDYPKFEMTKSSVKYALLARGQNDIVWYLTTGLYDKRALEHLAHHAAGVLIAAESGAAIADLDGNPIDWCGPMLRGNRGLVATDPGTVPLMGLVDAVRDATTSSQEAYEKRCEKRKEVSKMLAHLFTTLEDFAENEEDLRGAAIVKKRGMQMLEDEEQMNDIAQESMNRDKPILGESTLVADNAFDGGDGSDLPMSPISTGS